MIEFKHVSIASKGHILFENLNLIIESQHHYHIKGRNGAGKTILLQAIAGLSHPSDGTITYDFIDPQLGWDERFNLRKAFIHYIPTHALQSVIASHPDFFYQQRYYTIGDVELPTVQDFLGKDKKFDHAIFPPSFNIEDFLSLELTRLSNGQLKKILIIRELMRSIPKVLLLDYPFDGLDAKSRTDLCEFIDRLANTFNIQMIMTDQGDHLPSVIDRVLVIDDFRVKEISPITETRKVAAINESSTEQPLHDERSVIVEMKDVQIKYGEHVIVDRLQWKIFKGDRWALTGRNGSGKTTIFSLIYADHPMAYSQKVFLFGKRRGSGESIWDIKKRISYLGPEQLHYFNTTTIRKTGHQFLLEHDTADAVDNIVSHFNAARLIEKQIQHLSSGQLQLLLLMKSFISSKELLLLDEPFQFLDWEMKKRVNIFLAEHLKASVTMIMITHDDRDVEHWTHLRLHLSSSSDVVIPQ